MATRPEGPFASIATGTRSAADSHTIALFYPVELGACDDAVDNDGRGGKDCADSDCWADPACPEACGNGDDDDDDGLADCNDPDCTPHCVESCHDGRDNNAEGRVDCADPGCPVESRPFPGQCGLEVSSDSFDNDGRRRRG